MICEVVEDLANHYRSMILPNGILERFQSVRTNQINIQSCDHPSISITWNGRVSLTRKGAHYSFEFGVLVAVHSSILGCTREEGEVEHLKLITDFRDGKFFGIIPAAASIEHYKTDGGQSFCVTARETVESVAGSSAHRGWSFESYQTLDFSTLLKRQQVIR